MSRSVVVVWGDTLAILGVCFHAPWLCALAAALILSTFPPVWSAIGSGLRRCV